MMLFDSVYDYQFKYFVFKSEYKCKFIELY